MAPWLHLIGIGADGVESLSPAARALVAQAEHVFGGARHLADVRDLVRGEAVAWPVPFARGIGAVMARRGRRVVVLASGDPFFFGVGSTLVRHLGDVREMACLPGVSSVTLACARLGWTQQDVRVHSLCGRPVACLAPSVQPGARIVALSADGTTPAMLAQWLTARGFGPSRLHVMQALGADREAVVSAEAQAGFGPMDDLNVVAAEIVAGPDACPLPRTAGLDDALFDHDGQLTRREIRAVTLSSLAPRRGERLWDIGAGAGSISIEWMLADPANRALAIERDPVRAARIARNAEALGVPGLSVLVGAAPDAIAGAGDGAPDAVFVGGAVSVAGVLEAAWAALRPGGRIVANAVTHEGEMALGQARGRFGGEMLRLSVERLSPVGSLSAFRPAMTVTQWIAHKHGGPAWG